jgi:hypothetical protein
MRETIEFRISEEHAKQFLEPGLGTRLGDSVRKVLLPMTDPRVPFIVELNHEFHRRGDSFYIYSHIHRHYTRRELEDAELLQLLVGSGFGPTGELCGTRYDDAAACPHCGAGAPQLTDLYLDAHRLSKTRDMASSLAGEIVLSARLVEALEAHGITGAEYRPVRHRTGKEVPGWRQLVITSAPVELVPPTLVGGGPFDLDEQGEYRCPREDLAGLNRISELWVKHSDHDRGDWVRTRQFIGTRRGLLRPRQQLLISPRLYRLLQVLNARGFALEVAHGVERATP